MRSRKTFAVIAAIALLLPAVAHAGRQVVFEGPKALRGFTHESVEFHVPGDWMRDPRLRGRIEGVRGGGRDVDVLVLRAADLAAWEKSAEVEPIFVVRRKKSLDLDVSLPGPGRYVLVVSNRFSMMASKEVGGRVLLTWGDDPALPRGEELLKQVRFVGAPAGLRRLRVAVGDGDTASAVFLDGTPGGEGFSIGVRRPGAEGEAPRALATLPGTIAEAGAVDVHADGDRDVLVVADVPDPAGPRRDVVLVCPRQGAAITLSLVWSGGGGSQPPEVRYGEGYAEARFAAEQSFLERVAEAYEGRSPRRE